MASPLWTKRTPRHPCAGAGVLAALLACLSACLRVPAFLALRGGSAASPLEAPSRTAAPGAAEPGSEAHAQGPTSSSAVLAGSAAGLAATLLVSSHQSRRGSRVARKPGRIIDALFGKGTLDKMLGSFQGEPKALSESSQSRLDLDSEWDGGRRASDDLLDRSLKRQEQQTAAIEKMMTELQSLMMSKVEEERRINAELRSDMDGLRTQIARVQESYSAACDQLELTSLESDSRVAQATEALAQERDDAEARSVEAKTRLTELEKQVEKIEDQRRRIQDQRDVIVNEIRNLGDIVLERGTERDQLQETKAETEQQKADVMERLAGIDAEKAALTDQIAAEQSEAEALQAEVEQAEGELSDLMDQRQVITREVNNLTSRVVDLDGEKALLNADIMQLSSQNSELGVRVRSLEGERASTQGKIDEEKVAVENLLEQKEGIEKDVEELLEQRSLIAKEVQSITSRVMESESDKEALVDAIRATKDREDRILESIHGLEDGKSSLQQQLEDSQAVVSKYEKEVDTMSGELEVLRRQRSMVVGEVSRLTDKVVEAAQYRDDLMEQVGSRNSVAAMLEGRIAGLESQNDGLRDRIAAGKRDNSELLQKQRAAEEALEDGKRMRATIAAEVGRLSDKVQEASLQRGELEESVFSKRGEKVRLEGRVASLAGETDLLSRTVDDASAERDRLVQRVLNMAEDGKQLQECVVLGEADKKDLLEKLAEARSKQTELELKLRRRHARFQEQLRGSSGSTGAERKLSAVGAVGVVSDVEAKLQVELRAQSQENQRMMAELRGMTSKVDELQKLQPV